MPLFDWLDSPVLHLWCFFLPGGHRFRLFRFGIGASSPSSLVVDAFTAPQLSRLRSERTSYRISRSSVFPEALSRSLVLQWQNGEIKPKPQTTFRRLALVESP